MNFSIVNVGLVGIGALLIMAAIQNKSPKQIVSDTVNGTKVSGSASTVQRAPDGPYTSVNGPYPNPEDPGMSNFVVTSP